MDARGFVAVGGSHLVLALVLASCSESSTNHDADATVVADRAEVNDLSPGFDQGTLDASEDDAFDATDDVPMDGGVDASTDRPEVFIPTAEVWAGVPLVDLGGILIPVDPHGVPAPGSECVGDAGVREGDPAIAPPRPVRPLSVSRVTSQRPTFQWVLPEGTTGARVEVCADRCCTRVLQTIEAEGTTVRPTTALPPGVVFWRMFGRHAGVTGARASYTWEFEVRRRDAPNDTSWGTIRDFNGDGFDDLIVFRQQTPKGDPSDLLLVLGSATGLRETMVTDVVAGHRPTRTGIGDFNGDGLADIVWDDRSGPLRTMRSWFEVVEGSRGRVRSSIQPDVGMLGDCAVTSQGAVVDWNGDGYSDLIFSVLFGCNFFSPVEASILLGYSGSPMGVATAPQWALRLSERFTHSFVSITAGLSDLDDDGYDDISVVSRFSGSGTSSVPTEHAILHGTTGGEPRIERIPEPTPVRGAWGNGVPASIGDVDGDGRQDFLLRLNNSSPVYIYRHSTGLSGPSSILTDPIGGGNFGFYFSSGDVNGDGLSDVIIASELATTMERDGFPINEGRVYVFLGSSGGVVSQPFWLERAVPLMGGPYRHLFGGHSVCPGDINGDGIDDIAMSDTLNSRLCVRYGRVGFANGSPDLCLDGVMPPGAASSY